MMNYREIDYEKDLNEVIQLLNSNFDTNHAKEAFLWKHVENPFGKSYGLLAVDDDKIVGIRMFMRWEFQNNSQIIKAMRPVDTCTDHNYRGKGIFKNLTLSGLDNLKGEYELIFNTPNANSKPGYLKMGWKTISQDFKYKVGIVNPLKKITDLEMVAAEEINFNTSWNKNIPCQTNISGDFLKWRYRNEIYKMVKFKDAGLVIYKTMKLKGIRTILLFDVFGEENNFNNYVQLICAQHRAAAVYYLDNRKSRQLKFLFNINRDSQTVVSKADKHNISEDIYFSMGDLEGRF